MKTVLAKSPFKVEESNKDTRHYPSGWRGALENKEADKQEKAGTVDILGEDKPVKNSTTPPPPTGDDLTSALHKVFDALPPEGWGADRVPNINVLKASLKVVCDMTVPLKAADRDAALASYAPENSTETDTNTNTDPDTNTDTTTTTDTNTDTNTGETE